MKKRNFVEWTMHYRQIVILVVTCLVAFGIYSLPYMRKNEFPDWQHLAGNGGTGGQAVGTVYLLL